MALYASPGAGPKPRANRTVSSRNFPLFDPRLPCGSDESSAYYAESRTISSGTGQMRHISHSRMTKGDQAVVESRRTFLMVSCKTTMHLDLQWVVPPQPVRQNLHGQRLPAPISSL